MQWWEALDVESEILPPSLAPLLKSPVSWDKRFSLSGFLLLCLQIHAAGLERLKVISNADIPWVQAEQSPYSSLIKWPAQVRCSKLSIKKCPSPDPAFKDLFLGLGSPQSALHPPTSSPPFLCYFSAQVPTCLTHTFGLILRSDSF